MLRKILRVVRNNIERLWIFIGYWNLGIGTYMGLSGIALRNAHHRTETAEYLECGT